MKNIIIICVCLLFLGCSKIPISVKQIDSNFPVIVMMDSSINKIDMIQFRLCYEIKKKQLKKIWLGPSDYFYPNEDGFTTASTLFYSYHNDTLEYVNDINNKKRFLSFFKTYQYVIDVVKPVDTIQEVQNNFQYYIDKMVQQRKDTLHIESIQQLKKSNFQFINDLLAKDRIIIQFVENEKPYEIGYSIEVK